MKIGVVRDNQVFVLGRERRARWLQHMPADFTEIELAGKNVVLVFGAKLIRLITMESAWRGRALMDEHRHEVGRRPFVVWLINRIVVLAVDAAINGVNQPIPKARGRSNEKRC